MCLPIHAYEALYLSSTVLAFINEPTPYSFFTPEIEGFCALPI